MEQLGVFGACLQQGHVMDTAGYWFHASVEVSVLDTIQNGFIAIFEVFGYRRQSMDYGWMLWKMECRLEGEGRSKLVVEGLHGVIQENYRFVCSWSSGFVHIMG